jgi:tetratricopeptide (TPR) repeat protein
MTALAALAGLAVAAVAAAGVIRPFRRGGAPALQRLADPLDDERRSLLRSIRELDEERAAGTIPEEDYRSLRRDTEVRAVAVLRALASMEHSLPETGALRDLRPVAANGGPRRRQINALPAIVVTAAVVAVSVPLLTSAIRDRAPGQSITGTDFADRASSLSFFARRVREHPHDVAAHLDLAARYADAGDLQDATAQYLDALALNPRNAEANASVGLLLYRSGDARGGLKYAERALETDASYPEGLFVEGVILARGLHRDGGAVAALRAYLVAAPYGAHRTEVLQLLRRLSRAKR